MKKQKKGQVKKPKHSFLTQYSAERVAEYWKDQPETMDLQEAVDHVAEDLIYHFKTDKHNVKATYYSARVADLFIGIEPMQLLANAIKDYADLEINKELQLVFVAKRPKKRGKK